MMKNTLKYRFRLTLIKHLCIFIIVLFLHSNWKWINWQKCYLRFCPGAERVIRNKWGYWEKKNIEKSIYRRITPPLKHHQQVFFVPAACINYSNGKCCLQASLLVGQSHKYLMNIRPAGDSAMCVDFSVIVVHHERASCRSPYTVSVCKNILYSFPKCISNFCRQILQQLYGSKLKRCNFRVNCWWIKKQAKLKQQNHIRCRITCDLPKLLTSILEVKVFLDCRSALGS